MRLMVTLAVFAAFASSKTILAEIRTTEDTSPSNTPPYQVSKVDLINQRTPTFQKTSDSAYTTPSFDPFGSTTCLNDGLIGEDATSQNHSTAVLDQDGAFSVIFDLNTSKRPEGYSITKIQTFAGHKDDRKSQSYQVHISKIDDDSFLPLGRFELLFNNPSPGFSRLTIENVGGGPLDNGKLVATGVDAVRFDMAVPRGGHSTVYREFDVFGAEHASATSEDEPAPATKEPTPASKEEALASKDTLDLSRAYWMLGDSKDRAVARRAGIWNDLTKEREWSDASGKFKVLAEYVDHDEKSVTIRKKDREKITVPLARLGKGENNRVKAIDSLKPHVIEDLQAVLEQRAKKREEEAQRIKQDEEKRRQAEAMIASRDPGWKERAIANAKWVIVHLTWTTYDSRNKLEIVHDNGFREEIAFPAVYLGPKICKGSVRRCYVQDADLADALANAGQFPATWSAEKQKQALFGLRITADLPAYGSSRLTGKEVAAKLGMAIAPFRYDDKATLAWFKIMHEKATTPGKPRNHLQNKALAVYDELTQQN